jgi:C1A family cysteine protease
MERKYGWIPEPEASKEKNLLYAVAKPGMTFPSELVIANVADALNQTVLGSCTAHGIIGNYLTGEKKNNVPFWLPSTLGLYYDERAIEGTTDVDAGAIIKDGIKVANQIGLGPATIWPYDTDKFTQKPPPEYYAAAQKNEIKYYASVNNSLIENLKLPIFHGNPVTFGFQVFTKFEKYTDGVLELPNQNVEKYLGGHCVYYYGYSDSKQAFLCRNSWGDWGVENGSFWMSYDYITSGLCNDFWVIRLA